VQRLVEVELPPVVGDLVRLHGREGQQQGGQRLVRLGVRALQVGGGERVGAGVVAVAQHGRADGGQVLGGARPVAGARAARPQRVGVEVDPLGGDASVGHRAEPAVAERKRVEEVVGGVPVPGRVGRDGGGDVVIGRHIDKLTGHPMSRGGTPNDEQLNPLPAAASTFHTTWHFVASFVAPSGRITATPSINPSYVLRRSSHG